MKILIAEDDPVSRRLLEATLRRWGYDVVVTVDGRAAWESLQQPDAPQLAILDWMMPGMDGVQVCQNLRADKRTEGVYVILLTAKGEKSDIVAGLDAGANDYVTKPFDREELRARLRVGVRVLELQESLEHRVHELQAALQEVRMLQGILPICSYCKKIRNDQNYWQQVEAYITAHTEARFSHAICPQCWNSKVVPELQQMGAEVPRVDEP